MKDSSIALAPSPVYNPLNQCIGKKQYKIKRRALAKAHEYAEATGVPFTVYECPHCHKFHIGKVRTG